MSILEDLGDEIWVAIEGLVPENRRRRIAKAIVSVLEDFEAEDIESTELYEAAYPSDDDNFLEEDDEEDDDF